MWNRTDATYKLKIDYPIIQGPFGGNFSSAKLVSTVSNLGGLGSFGLNSFGPEEIVEIGESIKKQTLKPFALNLWVPLKDDPVKNYNNIEFKTLTNSFKLYFDELKIPVPSIPKPKSHDFSEQVEAVLKVRPPVVSFIFGCPPKEVIAELKKVGTVIIATTTTLEEAQLIEGEGIDLIVASGMEAGGHRASFLKTADAVLTNTNDLVSQLVKHIKTPVIAAGGISNGKRMVELLKLGASAVQVGTAFLATNESNATPEHKKRLLHNKFETTLTKVYTGRLARVIKNRLTNDFKNSNKIKFAPYPIQSAFLSSLRKAAIEQNKWDYVAFWSGQPSSILKHDSAKELFDSMVNEASLNLK